MGRGSSSARLPAVAPLREHPRAAIPVFEASTLYPGLRDRHSPRIAVIPGPGGLYLARPSTPSGDGQERCWVTAGAALEGPRCHRCLREQCVHRLAARHLAERPVPPDMLDLTEEAAPGLRAFWGNGTPYSGRLGVVGVRHTRTFHVVAALAYGIGDEPGRGEAFMRGTVRSGRCGKRAGACLATAIAATIAEPHSFYEEMIAAIASGRAKVERGQGHVSVRHPSVPAVSVELTQRASTYVFSLDVWFPEHMQADTAPEDADGPRMFRLETYGTTLHPERCDSCEDTECASPILISTLAAALH